MDAQKASNEAAVRRENIIAELWTALQDKRLKGQEREEIQQRYDYIRRGGQIGD